MHYATEFVTLTPKKLSDIIILSEESINELGPIIVRQVPVDPIQLDVVITLRRGPQIGGDSFVKARLTVNLCSTIQVYEPMPTHVPYRMNISVDNQIRMVWLSTLGQINLLDFKYLFTSPHLNVELGPNWSR